MGRLYKPFAALSSEVLVLVGLTVHWTHSLAFRNTRTKSYGWVQLQGWLENTVVLLS